MTSFGNVIQQHVKSRSGFGYHRWGYGGGIGIGGILLIVLVVYLLLGRERF